VTASAPRPLRELSILFTRLGFTAFGGPAAHIAMMHDEVVTRRSWMTDQEFLDLIGATNLIPGPNSTEMAIHVGRVRAGLAGLLVAGGCFIAPAFAIVLVLAWAYVRYGTTPAAEAILYGISPVIIAIVLQAIWKLGRTSVRDVTALLVAVVALGLYLLGVHELVIIAGAGAVLLAIRRGRDRWSRQTPGVLLLAVPALVLRTAAEAIPVSGWRLLLTFLKIGAVLYGSGYVLLAFLRADFVVHLGWITERQLLDAVAIGQFTPGPLFTTATFVGYLVLGVPGAGLATLGIFLPSFVLVALTGPLIPRIRHSTWMGDALDGVNAGSLALMAGVTIQLARDAVIDVPTAILAAVAAFVLFRFRVNSVWIVLGGALAGLALHPFS
jgi:chromate transporter